MPLINRAHEMQQHVAEWRRHLHENPELMYDVHETSRFAAEKLRDFGCDSVETGIGKTGLVGIIRGRHGDGPVIGLPRGHGRFADNRSEWKILDVQYTRKDARMRP